MFFFSFYHDIVKRDVWTKIRRNYSSCLYPVKILHYENLQDQLKFKFSKYFNLISSFNYILLYIFSKYFFSVIEPINKIFVTDILIIYFGNNNKSSFKLFGQVKSIERNVFELTSRFEKPLYEFLIVEKIENGFIRNVCPRFDEELGAYSAIDNIVYSPLKGPILNPGKLLEQKSDPKESIRNFDSGNLSKEQQSIADDTISMCMQDQPNLKLIEGPPGSGKTLLVSNIVLNLLTRNLNSKKIPKILICAKNNSAVDTLMKQIVLSNDSAKYSVRFGVNYIDSELLKFSINNLIKHEWQNSQTSNYRDMENRVNITTSKNKN